MHCAGIDLTNLTKRFGQQTVLEKFDLNIKPGEFVVLLGPSGCGKSTLLRLIAGLEMPSEGRIKIGERDVTDFPPRMRDIAMVFQSYALYAHLSVKNNISFPIKMRKWRWWYEIPGLGRLFPGRKAIERHLDSRAGEVAATVGLDKFLHRKPRELSGGQRQRVALARAMISDPQIFLMDEPLSNLDAQLRTATRAEIIRLHQRLGRTFVYVTHDQVEAMTMGSRVIILDGGRIKQDGSPQDLYDAPANTFVAGFIGTPPMNLLPATVIDSALRIGAYDIPSSSSVVQKFELADGAKMTVGFRPERITIGDSGIPARVDIVERLGTEQLVTAVVADISIQIRCDMSRTFGAGDLVHILFDTEAAHVFDGISGDRVKEKTQ